MGRIKENNKVKGLTGCVAAVFCLYLCGSTSQLRFTSQKRKAFHQAGVDKDGEDTRATNWLARTRPPFSPRRKEMY